MEYWDPTLHYSITPTLDWCRDAELNCGHVDFQSTALPTELSRHVRAAFRTVQRLERSVHSRWLEMQSQLPLSLCFETGGDDGTRTRGLLRDRQAL